MTRKIFLNLSLSVLLLIEVFHSQDLWVKLRTDARTFAQNSASYFMAPLHFEKKDFLHLAFVGVNTAFLFGFDHVSSDFKKLDTDFIRAVMKIDRYYGTIWMFGAITGSLYSFGILSNNDNFRELGLMVLEAGTLSSLVTFALKVAVGRERPYVSGNKFKFRPFSFEGDKFYSFPSGHSSLGFAISTVVASRFGNNFAKILIYVPAVLTALARVYNGQHWFSDVFFGSAIGYFSAIYIVNVHRNVQK